jgi:exosortase
MTLDGTTTRAPSTVRLAAWLQLGVVLALLAAVYHRTAGTLWTTWTTNDNYSHGPLVPLASLGLVWLDRARLTRLSVRPDGRGLLLIAAACALQVLGMRADVFALEGWSLVVMLFGLVWTFLGSVFVQALAFPIGFLAFMLTFPPFVINTLSFGLKEITVRLSTRIAEWLGVALQRNGMVIVLDSGEFRIENPCSGLRSLLTLLATGALFAHFQPGGWPRRALLFLSAVPIAMAANAVRITGLLVVGHYQGVEKAHRLHDASGILVYALALLGLFAVRAILAPRSLGREPSVTSRPRSAA